MTWRLLPSLSLALAALAVGSVACAPDAGVVVQSNVARDENPLVSTADLAALQASELHVAGALLVDGGARNVLASPHSIVDALAMLDAGAHGATATQMQEALALPDAHVHEALDKLDLALAARNHDDVVVRNANAVWSQAGLALERPYLDVLAEDYGAGVHTLDFAKDAEGARAIINNWVSYETDGRIPELFPARAIDSSTRLALTNALYFHAPWQTAFSAIGNHTFHLASNASAAVPFMESTTTMKHAIVDDSESVEIPYANAKLSLLVVVPDAGKLDDVAANVDGALLADIDAAASDANVDLLLPKLELRSRSSLVPELEKLGMHDAFDGKRADFSGIDGGRDLVVQSVVHDAWLLVDEHGTTGAAGTGVTLAPTAIAPGPRVVVNRPYLLFVRDASGAVLFAAKVLDPRT